MLKIGIMFKNYFDDKDRIIKEMESLGVVPILLDTKEDINLDYIFCFGGDGTILRSLKFALFYNVPILGVNFGKIGFLTSIQYKELEKSVNALKTNKFNTQSRMLLDISVIRENQNVYQGVALNEAVVIKAHNSKLIKLKLTVNKKFIYDARADGLIVSTPTGSTAYSLSARGPIVMPNTQVLLVTPLNSSKLNISSIVLDKYDVIEIVPVENHVMHLQSDGNVTTDIHCNDKIVIKKSDKTINFVVLSENNFYHKIRKLLC